MNKCEHGDKITHFCVTDNCQYKEGAACELCLKKYHSHIIHNIHITEQEMQHIIKKFALDNTVKPKCRILQESIYNYFNQIKSEIASSLDIVCKNIINQIGYPYLFSINGISTYKRLKNKEYRKITQKQFRAFYQLANKVQDGDLIKQENKIYLQEIKCTNQILSKLESIIHNYQQCTKRYHQNFVHDRAEQHKISDMIKSIGQQSTKNHRKNMESSISNSKQLQIFANNKNDIKSYQAKTVQKQRQRLETPSVLVPPRSQNRQVSLDKRVIKQHKFPVNDKLVQKTKESQDSQSNLGSKKIQKLKVELSNKQMHINEKKKLLIDIMKHTHTQKSQNIEISIKPSSIQISPFKSKNTQVEHKKQIQSTQPKSINQSKSSMQSQQIFVMEQNGNKQVQVTNYAFTKLPIQQKVKKPQQKQQVKKRMIVIPQLANLKGINNNRMDELDSPLYKKKRIEQTKIKQQPHEKHPNRNGQIQQKWVCRQMLEIKDNQQKSLALLLKSLTLSAEQAIAYLQSSLKYADNNLSAAEYLSYLYLQTNRAKDCLVLCNKFIDKIQNTSQPQQISLNINNNKAAALNVLGRYSQAILILQNCLKYKEKDTFYKNLADSYFSIGMHDKAIYNYQKSIKMNASNDESHYNLAVCLYMQQNYKHCEFSIKKALEINPKQERYIELQGFIDAKIKSL